MASFLFCKSLMCVFRGCNIIGESHPQEIVAAAERKGGKKIRIGDGKIKRWVFIYFVLCFSHPIDPPTTLFAFCFIKFLGFEDEEPFFLVFKLLFYAA